MLGCRTKKDLELIQVERAESRTEDGLRLRGEGDYERVRVYVCDIKRSGRGSGRGQEWSFYLWTRRWSMQKDGKEISKRRTNA